MLKAKCKCGAAEMTFQFLNKGDLPDGWECPKCNKAVDMKKADVNDDGKVDEKDVEMVKEAAEKSEAKSSKKSRKSKKSE